MKKIKHQKSQHQFVVEELLGAFSATFIIMAL